MKLRIIFERMLLIIFVLIILFVGGAILRNGWTNTWRMLGIPSMTPIFADMRTVQGSIKSEELGFDPQVTNPGDPWYRSMNYPKIWIWIAKLVQLENETNYIVFIGAYILAYLLCCFLLLRITPSFYVLLIIFSGASLLALERGNNDLLAFVILFIGIYFSQNYFRAITILIATILKVYPVLLVFMFVKKTKMFLLLISLIAVYFILTAGELRIIMAGNTALTDPASLYATYGWATTFKNVAQLMRLFGQSVVIYEIYKYVLIIVSIILIILLSRKKILVDSNCSTEITDLFVAGAIIFSGTYIITSNWDYRLIFLLFCIPYIMNIQHKPIKYLLLFSIIVSINSLFLSTNTIMHIIGQFGISLCIMCKYSTFILITSLLVKEIKQYLPINSLDFAKAYVDRMKP
jgi:hypothetical protein